MQRKPKLDVVIAGAGPTGLFLGLALLRAGLEVLVLEQKTERDRHSRSIGIHPPSLDLLHAAGVGGAFEQRGVKIREGIAFSGGVEAGRLDFGAAGHTFPFVLALPQYETESLLEQAVCALNPAALRKGVSNIRYEETAAGVDVLWEDSEGPQRQMARFLAGCDGKHSGIRQQAGLAFHGGAYPDTYVMADFPDTTPWPAQAALFFHPEGIVESFPLPGGVRRWVVKTPQFHAAADAAFVAQQVFSRTGWTCDADRATMAGGFGVQHFIASRFANGRVVLAGDAAHIVSPIGGQGMNLGWMDAWHLAGIFADARMRDMPEAERALARYSRMRRQRTLVAMHSAYFNMAMGRASRFHGLKTSFIRLLATPVFRRAIARRFTMQGLVTR